MSARKNTLTRSIYRQKSKGAGRWLGEQVLDTFQTCPMPEVARLGRALRAWRNQVLAHFDTPEPRNCSWAA